MQMNLIFKEIETLSVENVGCLCSSVVRAVDRQSKDLGSNPSAVESIYFSTERFSNSLNTFQTFTFVPLKNQS